jgi:hypothetical protein
MLCLVECAVLTIRHAALASWQLGANPFTACGADQRKPSFFSGRTRTGFYPCPFASRSCFSSGVSAAGTKLLVVTPIQISNGPAM